MRSTARLARLRSASWFTAPLLEGKGTPTGDPVGKGTPTRDPVGKGTPTGDPVGKGTPTGDPVGKASPVVLGARMVAVTAAAPLPLALP